jgi:hypothetical protein
MENQHKTEEWYENCIWSIENINKELKTTIKNKIGILDQVFGGARVWTQALPLARQVFYYFSHIPRPKIDILDLKTLIFEMENSVAVVKIDFKRQKTST